MTMQNDAGVAALLDAMRDEFPSLRVVHKRGDILSHAIDRGLRVLTLGGQDGYLTRYHTVIGTTLYLPTSWHGRAPVDQLITLRHERVHLRQLRRYGFARMAFIYLLLPLPLGLAYGRARLEWEAYRETLRATWELKGAAAARDPALREHILRQFTGPAYGWMWPFRSQLERWYDTALHDLAIT